MYINVLQCSSTIMAAVVYARYIMLMIVSMVNTAISNNCETLSFICILRDFLSGKVRFMHTSNVTRSHLSFEKNTRTPRVHLV